MNPYEYGQEVDGEANVVTIAGRNPKVTIEGNEIDTRGATVLATTPRHVGPSREDFRAVEIAIVDSESFEIIAEIKTANIEVGDVYASFIRDPATGVISHDRVSGEFPTIVRDGDILTVSAEDKSANGGPSAAKAFTFTVELPVERLWEVRDAS